VTKFGFLEIPVNRLLRDHPTAQQRLAAHLGKTARFSIAPLPDVSLTVIEIDGIPQVAVVASTGANDIPATAHFTLTPGLLLRLLAQDASAYRDVNSGGDAGFVADIFFLAKNLRPDIEEDLSHWIGDIAAHRVVQSGQRWRQWQAQTTQHFGEMFAEYATEEVPLLAPRLAVQQFIRDVDTLRDDLERLDKRVDRLASAKP